MIIGKRLLSHLEVVVLVAIVLAAALRAPWARARDAASPVDRGPSRAGASRAPEPLPPRGAELESGPVPETTRASPRRELTVPRAVVGELLENHPEVVGALHLLPEERGGRVVGVRLSGLQPDTLPRQLGLDDGDVLLTLNGIALSTPDGILEAYARLRTDEHATLTLERGGARVELEYVIE